MKEQWFDRGLFDYPHALGCAFNLMAIDLYYRHCYRYPEIEVPVPSVPAAFHPVLNPAGVR